MAATKNPSIRVMPFVVSESAFERAKREELNRECGLTLKAPSTIDIPYMETDTGFLVNSSFWGYKRLLQMVSKYSRMSHREVGEVWKALPPDYKSTGISAVYPLIAMLAAAEDKTEYWTALEATVISDCCRYWTANLMSAVRLHPTYKTS